MFSKAKRGCLASSDAGSETLSASLEPMPGGPELGRPPLWTLSYSSPEYLAGTRASVHLSGRQELSTQSKPLGPTVPQR